MSLYTSAQQLIGNTPLLELGNFAKKDTAICIFLKKVPSFNSINPNLLELLLVLTQPLTTISLSAYSAVFL